MMNKVPEHLGIILDGNRRWAQEKGLSLFEGHKRGLEKVKKVIGWCKERGIKTLSLFVFSTENWQRPKPEVNYLMKLTQKAITQNLSELIQAGVRVKVIGQQEKFSDSLKKAIENVEESTKNNKSILLNFALSYGGRAEITEVLKKLIAKNISPEQITEKVIAQNLWASDLDLIVRTGKEQRLSNFLIWQAAYAELYFSPKYWPDFTENDLDDILKDYSRRQRRFGR